MPPSISVTLRVEDARLEIGRLRCELRAWLDARRKRDTLQQFRTQLGALEEVLLKALAGVETELGVAGKTQGLSGIDVCRRVERGTVWVRRVWSFFRWRFDQRDDSRIGRLLAAADEVVWSCYVEPFRAAGLEQPAVPLAYIDDRFSPYAVPRVDLPSDLRFDVDAAFIRDFLTALPIPVLGLPPVCVEYPWWLAFVGHEVGHHVQYDLVPKAALVEDFKIWLAGAVGEVLNGTVADRWKSWGREIFADAWSVVTMGPAALWALVDLEVGAENRLLRSYAAYPPPFVRFALMAALLRKLGVSPVESLRGLDPEGARTGPPLIVDGRDQRAQLGEDLDVVPRVADKLAGVAVAHNLTLRELGRWQEGDFVPFGTTAGWTAAFGAADEPKPVETVESARLATSGAVWAWSSFLEQPATEDARTHLRDRVVRTIAKSREQDVRAATPPSGFAAADAGDRLCALVLTQAPEDGPGQP